jgi:chorismate mutase/prephenate dehydratase
LTNEALSSIYREVISASISLQKDLCIGFLGPAGTYTHQVRLLFLEDLIYLFEFFRLIYYRLLCAALATQFSMFHFCLFQVLISYNIRLTTDLVDVFDAVERKRVDYGVVPLENSTIGGINQTLDRFLSSNLRIRSETYLPVRIYIQLVLC